MKKHRSCYCCPPTEEILSLETKLYNGFGGWNILKDGIVIFEGDDFDDWDSITELSFYEDKAKQEPESKWQAHLFLPLREARYERQKCGNWKLIETGPGFA